MTERRRTTESRTGGRMEAANATALWRAAAEECERLLGANASAALLLLPRTHPSSSSPSPPAASQCLEHAPTLTHASATRAAVLAALALLSLAGNVATIVSIRRGQRGGGGGGGDQQRRCSGALHGVYALILHLSVADLLVTLFCIAGEAAWSYSVAWVAGNAACKAFKFAQMFALYLSTFVLVLIGVDRFVVVRYPMKSLSSAKRLNKLVLFVWLLSMLLSVPQLVIFHVERGPFIEDFEQCVTYGFYTEEWQEQLYTTFSLVCMFLLPLLILVATYVSTVITISRSEKMFRAEVATGDKLVASDVNRRRLMHRAKMKSLRISVVIVVAFIVWWTPYYTMMVIFMFLKPDKHLSEDLQSWIFFFGMSNSLVNPIIYGAFHLWNPQKKKLSSNSGYRHSFRSGNSLHRRATYTNSVVMDPHGSTRVVCSKHHSRGIQGEDETSLVSLEEVSADTQRHSVKFLQRYRDPIGSVSKDKTPI